MQVSSISFAYPTVDGAARAGLTRRLLAAGGGFPAFVLSTCLRIEVVCAGDASDLDRIVDKLFGDAPPAGERRSGEEAVHHLFRVAAGLASPILGEQEILTQFRHALMAAEDAGVVDGLMARLLESAVATGRQARELLPGSPHDSMAAVAAQVVGASPVVAVLGSGAMATAVVAGLLALPAPPDVVVVARHPEKVALAGVEVWPFTRASEALAALPAVVSATSAKHRPISDHELAVVLGGRISPLTLVDMAMPPDFAPDASAPVCYVDIDMLARMAGRRARSSEADAIVTAAAADAFRRYSEHHALGPVIGGLTRTADDLVDRTVDRFAGRLGDAADREVMRQAVHTVARTLLATPIGYLQSADRRSDAVDVIAEAFGLRDA